MQQVTTIYEDDEIAASFFDAGSSDLLITFGDLATLWSNGNFYGRKVVEKLSISTLGIMAKKPDWYPPASIKALEAHTRALLSCFRHRTLHGSSMGGYACVKYSAIFSANTVFSFSPQWSISPETTQGHAVRWSSHYTSTMANMEITRADVAGKIFLFADPYDRSDFYHRKMISDRCTDAVEIDIFGAGHSVSAVLAGTSNFRAILEACLSNDLQALKEVCNLARRKSAFRAFIVAERAIEVHPRMVADALGNVDHSRPEFHLFCKLNGARLLRSLALASGGRVTDAILVDIIPHLSTKSEIIRSILVADRNVIGNLRIVSHHGTYLLYDVSRDQCVHNEQHDGLYLPLSLQFDGARVAVGVETRLGFLEIGVHISSGALRPIQRGDDMFDSVELNDGPGGLCLKSRGAYVSAEPDGALVCNRSNAGSWEAFGLVAHRADSS